MSEREAKLYGPNVFKVMDRTGKIYRVKAIMVLDHNFFRGEWIEGPNDGNAVVVDYSSLANDGD